MSEPKVEGIPPTRPTLRRIGHYSAERKRFRYGKFHIWEEPDGHYRIWPLVIKPGWQTLNPAILMVDTIREAMTFIDEVRAGTRTITVTQIPKREKQPWHGRHPSTLKSGDWCVVFEGEIKRVFDEAGLARDWLDAYAHGKDYKMAFVP